LNIVALVAFVIVGLAAAVALVTFVGGSKTGGSTGGGLVTLPY